MLDLIRVHVNVGLIGEDLSTKEDFATPEMAVSTENDRYVNGMARKTRTHAHVRVKKVESIRHLLKTFVKAATFCSLVTPVISAWSISSMNFADKCLKPA